MEPLITAVAQALQGTLEAVVRLGLPLAVGGGLVFLWLLRTPEARPTTWDGRKWSSYGLLALLTIGLWSALRTAAPRAHQEIAWRESTEATTNLVSDAPAVTQYAPALAALRERTYTRTLTLPTDFFQRISTDGLGVIAPYLTDPTAESVLKLVDTFRRSGRDVVFTREVVRLDEEPIPFALTALNVDFTRQSGRAYEAHFVARYAFQNATDQPITARFVFPLPQQATVRELSVAVGSEAIREPDDNGAYLWKGILQPGERREALVQYRVTGARTWQYDLGSRRRRVQQFTLDSDTGGVVQFVRGSLPPTRQQGHKLHWELSNVVTEQKLALAFPPDVSARDGYLQALTALPVSLLVCLLGGLWAVREPRALVTGLLLFGLGLGSVPTLANYVGGLAALLLGPLLGAVLSLALWRGRSAPTTALAALLPATFLSPQHTGLLLILLIAVTMGAGVLLGRKRESQ